MIMYKTFLISSILLLLGLFCACSSSGDEENDGLKPGDIVSVFGDVKAVYEPISSQNAPEQIKPILLEKGGKGVHLFQGKRNGETIYYLRTIIDSGVGNFFDENWERLIIDTDYTLFFSETSNWKLIFYKK
jgi:hypothetical protein